VAHKTLKTLLRFDIVLYFHTVIILLLRVFAGDEEICVFHIQFQKLYFKIQVRKATLRAQVIFVESETSKFLKSSHDLVESSQSRVTKPVKSLQVIGLQARLKLNLIFLLCLFFI